MSGLCELRLIKDSRWPWLVLIPQRPAVSEIFEMTPLDQTMLTFEMNSVAAALKQHTEAMKSVETITKQYEDAIKKLG